MNITAEYNRKKHRLPDQKSIQDTNQTEKKKNSHRLPKISLPTGLLLKMRTLVSNPPVFIDIG